MFKRCFSKALFFFSAGFLKKVDHMFKRRLGRLIICLNVPWFKKLKKGFFLQKEAFPKKGRSYV